MTRLTGIVVIIKPTRGWGEIQTDNGRYHFRTDDIQFNQPQIITLGTSVSFEPEDLIPGNRLRNAKAIRLELT